LKTWWRCLRVGDWGIQLVLLCLVSLVYLGIADIEPREYLAHLGRVSLWTAVVLSGAYLVNNYHDRSGDLRKAAHDGLVQEHPRLVFLLGVGCLAASAALLALMAPSGPIKMVGTVQVMAALAYSTPWPRLKERGVWGLITAATMQRIPAFLMLVLAFPLRPGVVAALLGWLLVVGLIFILEHQLLDLRHDAGARVRTWATRQGRMSSQVARFRLYRLFGFVSWAAAGIILIDSPDLSGAGSALLLLAISGLVGFLVPRRHVGNRSLPRRHEMPRPQTRDKIVIHGAGLSGLMAAIKLADWGRAVEIREKRPGPGSATAGDSSVHAVRFDPGYLEEYLDCPLTGCFEPVERETLYLEGRARLARSPHWVCKRGSDPDSLDSYLLALAHERGIDPVYEDDTIDLKTVPDRPMILATGLAPESYRDLGIDHVLLSGFSATGPCTGRNRLLTYIGSHTHPGYAYVASARGVIHALIFSRQGVAADALAVFEDRLWQTERIEFAEWRPMAGAVPRQCQLLHSGRILTGMLSGMMDPFWYSGVSGALLSGAMAAVACVHPTLAEMEHRHSTRNFGRQLVLADLGARLPWPCFLGPWLINGLIDPAGSLGRWCWCSSVRPRQEAVKAPAVELQENKIRGCG
jgi:hypothetical protein